MLGPVKSSGMSPSEPGRPSQPEKNNFGDESTNIEREYLPPNEAPKAAPKSEAREAGLLFKQPTQLAIQPTTPAPPTKSVLEATPMSTPAPKYLPAGPKRSKRGELQNGIFPGQPAQTTKTTPRAKSRKRTRD